jgi:hypothetical protein
MTRAISWNDVIVSAATMYLPFAAGFSAAAMCASATSRTSAVVKLKSGAP